jgi:hypothetical protein
MNDNGMGVSCAFLGPLPPQTLNPKPISNANLWVSTQDLELANTGLNRT